MAPREASKSLNTERQFEILKVELGVLQGRMDKYDDLIFRSRGWTVTIVAALVAGSVQLRSPSLLFVAGTPTRAILAA